MIFLLYDEWFLEEELEILIEGFTPASTVIRENGTTESSLVDDNFGDEIVIPDSIYRLGHSDTWACHNCNAKGDKWFMIKHPQYCRGGKLKPKSGGSK